MADVIAQFFTSQARHLGNGRFDLLVRPYGMPLVMLLPEGYPRATVFRSRDRIEAFFRSKFEGLRSSGLSYLRTYTGTLKARERCVCHVNWRHVEEIGGREGETRANYFIERRTGALTVSMVEFVRLGFPIADRVSIDGDIVTHRLPLRFLH